MSFQTPSSTALGWGNFLTDYLGGSVPTGVLDTYLQRALSDAQNGTNGAVQGGTIYFPPIGPNAYLFSQTFMITGSCALISPSSADVSFTFNPSGGTTQSLFVIEGSNVTIRGFSIQNTNPVVAASGNVAAIQVIGASGVLLEDVLLQGFFAGVDCAGSSTICDSVHADGFPVTTGTSQMAFGFRAQPGPGSGSLAGLTMRIRQSHVGLGLPTSGANTSTGTAGFILVPPYPDMSIENSDSKNGQYGFYIVAASGSTAGNSGFMRLRNLNSEQSTSVIYADGGSVIQSGASVIDGNATYVTLSTNFAGAAAFAGEHYSSVGQGGGFLIGNPASGSTPEQPSPAVAAIVGSTLSQANATAGLFLASTASGSVVLSSVAMVNFTTGIQVGAVSAGPATIVGSSWANSEYGLLVETPSASATSSVVLEATSIFNPQNPLLSTTFPASGNNVSVHNGPPLNPAGYDTPLIPSGMSRSVVNNTGYDVVAYIYDVGGKISGITVDEANTGISSVATLPATYPVFVPAGATITVNLTSTSSPTFEWTWLAN